MGFHFSPQLHTSDIPNYKSKFQIRIWLNGKTKELNLSTVN